MTSVLTVQAVFIYSATDSQTDTHTDATDHPIQATATTGSLCNYVKVSYTLNTLTSSSYNSRAKNVSTRLTNDNSVIQLHKMSWTNHLSKEHWRHVSVRKSKSNINRLLDNVKALKMWEMLTVTRKLCHTVIYGQHIWHMNSRSSEVCCKQLYWVTYYLLTYNQSNMQ